MRYDVVIIGAGPAGLECAGTLAKAGRKVLVLDSGMGKKVCAGGLSHKVLSFMDIPEELISRSFCSIRLHLGRRSLDMTFRKPIIATVARQDLSGWHHDKVLHKNMTLIDEVSRIEIIGSRIHYDNRTAEFSYLVGADGAHSLVRKHLNIPTTGYLNAIQTHIPIRARKLEMIVMTRPLGYLWVFPHKNTTSFGAGALNSEASMLKLKNILDRFIKKRKLIASEYSAGIISFDHRIYRKNNIFLCGEAAGLCSAISGEGIYFALVSGREVAKEILRPGYRSLRLQKIRKKVKKDMLIVKILKAARLLGIAETIIPAFIRFKYKRKKRKLI